MKKYIRPNNVTSGTLRLVSFLVLIVMLFAGQSVWWWIVAYYAHFVYYCVDEAVGQHRYFTHKAFKVNKFWHNNHHYKPNSKTTKVKWWELDPAYWLIRLVEEK